MASLDDAIAEGDKHRSMESRSLFERTEKFLRAVQQR